MDPLYLCNTARGNLGRTNAIFPPCKTCSMSYDAFHLELGKQSPDLKLTSNSCRIVNFLATVFRRQGHNVLGTSRSDYSQFCKEHDITFFRDINGMCEVQPDVVLLCNSISSTEEVLNKIQFQVLKPDTIIADVLSVKQYPKKLLLDAVPPGFGILCTHPMFGKFSGEHSWEGLRFVYDKVRLAENSNQEHNCQRFLNIFQDEGCQMVEMSCEEHDRYAAESQFITHTVARILSLMNLESTPIDTKGYETLLKLTQKTSSLSYDLYEGLYIYNTNAEVQIDKLDRAFKIVKEKLHDKVHKKLRKNIEGIIALDGRKNTRGKSTHVLYPR